MIMQKAETKIPRRPVENVRASKTQMATSKAITAFSRQIEADEHPAAVEVACISTISFVREGIARECTKIGTNNCALQLKNKEDNNICR